MPQNRSARRFLFALLVVSLAGVIYWGTAAMAFRRQVRRLPNGSSIAIEAITYGPEHRFTRAAWWLRMVRPFMSKRDWEALGGVDVRRTIPDPAVPVVWVTRTPESGLGFGFDTNVTVFDNHGCEALILGQHFQRDVTGHTGVSSYPLSAFPRRGDTLGLRVYQRVNGPWKRAAEFRLSMPKQPTPPRWPRAPVPVTVRDGELSCTLSRFITGAYDQDAARPAQGNDICEAWTYLTFKVQQRGRPTAEWVPVSVEFRDPGGNIVAPGAPYLNPRRQGATTKMSFMGNLLPEEDTWKLRVELARAPTATFGASELWTVRNVPIPRRTESFASPSRPFERRLDGGMLTVSSIRWDSMGPPYAEVDMELEAIDIPDLWISLVRAVDDRGRAISLPRTPETFSYFGWTSPIQTQFRLPLLITKQTRTVDLTLAVQRTRFVELLATPNRPPVARTARGIGR
jgi:hypothetical protein